VSIKGQVSPFSQGLTALLVDDDAPTRMLLATLLKGVFKVLHTARDGKEGLEAFHRMAPDVVLADQSMPRMSGTAMVAEIRKADPKVPIIFITSSMDTDILVEAINLGISAFVPKPVTAPLLAKAVALVAGLLENDHLQRKTLEQELALLQLREKYNDFQQETAFRKELGILENEFLVRSFEGTGGQGEWMAQVQYVPHDIMCGDSWSLRRLPDGGMLVYLADAMGKGLAAALTSSLGAHTFNLQVDALPEGPFDFSLFIARFISRLGKRLLEDEIFSFLLAWLPLDAPVVETASFGMPPILADAGEGPVQRFVCDNPPLSPFSDDFRTTRRPLGGARKLLFYTDGLNESSTLEGELYRDSLPTDLRGAASRDQLWTAFQRRVERPDDDVTFIFLARVDLPVLWREARRIPARLSALDACGLELETLLARRTALDETTRDGLGTALREALMNAYEHGSLGAEPHEKRALLEEGTWIDRLLEREVSSGAFIDVELTLHDTGYGHLLKCVVRDEGPGFPVPTAWPSDRDLLALSGRGLKMIRKYSDGLFLNEKGNAITFFKAFAR